MLPLAALVLLLATNAAPARPQVWVPTPRDLQVPYDRIDDPAISPDGQTVAFSALDPNDHAHIFIVPSEGGTPTCLLYTSDAADERSSVDLGGRRIIKKK